MKVKGKEPKSSDSMRKLPSLKPDTSETKIMRQFDLLQGYTVSSELDRKLIEGIFKASISL